MKACELDIYILKKILSLLSNEQIDTLMIYFREDTECYQRLSEIIDELKNKKVIPDKEKDLDIRQKWRAYLKTYNNRFDKLMEKYMKAYLEKEKKEKHSGKKSDLEHLISNHTKWNRMMTQRGQGIQYQDDIRRICFVFRLTYPEANELMWSAGQLFDMDNLRDFILVDCLTKGIYDIENINKRLSDQNLKILFPAD